MAVITGSSFEHFRLRCLSIASNILSFTAPPVVAWLCLVCILSTPYCLLIKYRLWLSRWRFLISIMELLFDPNNTHRHQIIEHK